MTYEAVDFSLGIAHPSKIPLHPERPDSHNTSKDLIVPITLWRAQLKPAQHVSSHHLPIMSIYLFCDGVTPCCNSSIFSPPHS